MSFIAKTLHILPLFLFFFILFSLVDITKILMMRRDSIEAHYVFSVVAISSLVFTKGVLISNELPIINTFSNKPLIYNTIWKSTLYIIMSFFVRVSERFIPSVLHGNGIIESLDSVYAEIQDTPFWIGHLWLAILFINFVAYQELVDRIGRKKVKHMFFGNKSGLFKI